MIERWVLRFHLSHGFHIRLKCLVGAVYGHAHPQVQRPAGHIVWTLGRPVGFCPRHRVFPRFQQVHHVTSKRLSRGNDVGARRVLLPVCGKRGS